MAAMGTIDGPLRPSGFTPQGKAAQAVMTRGFAPPSVDPTVASGVAQG